MKKLFTIFTVALSMVTSLAFAKTEGTYIGADVIRTAADWGYVDPEDRSLDSSNSGDSVGYGINVGYAISLGNIYKGLYIAPNAYYNANETDATNSTGGISQTWEIKNSYGVNIDLGYDINDKFSVYASTGYVEFRSNVGSTIGTAPEDTDLGGSVLSESFSYGLGVKYNIDDRLSLRLAYDTFSADANGPGVTKTVNSFDVEVIKIGAAYSF